MEDEYKTFISIKDFKDKIENPNIKLFRKKQLYVDNNIRDDYLNRGIHQFNINDVKVDTFEDFNNDRLYARISENNDTHLYLLLYKYENNNIKGGKRNRKRNKKSNKTKRRRRRNKPRMKRSKKRQRR